jgi:hypothetical protein
MLKIFLLSMAATILASSVVKADDPSIPSAEQTWAVGRPKSEAAMKMAPIAGFPIPTAADQLPRLKAPPGFKVDVWVSGVLDARGLREGDKGTVFVSSLFVAGKVYAVTDRGGRRDVRTVADKLNLPNGIEVHDGALYVSKIASTTRPSQSSFMTSFLVTSNTDGNS